MIIPNSNYRLHLVTTPANDDELKVVFTPIVGWRVDVDANEIIPVDIFGSGLVGNREERVIYAEEIEFDTDRWWSSKGEVGLGQASLRKYLGCTP